MLAIARLIITLYCHGTGLHLICKSATRDASLSYMMEVASGETMRRLLMLHSTAGRVLGNMRNRGGTALPAWCRGPGPIAWCMLSYHRAIPMSLVSMITQSERTWGRLFAVVPRLGNHFTCTPGYSHNAVAEQHIRLCSLQCNDTRCYFSIDYGPLSSRSIRSSLSAAMCLWLHFVAS